MEKLHIATLIVATLAAVGLLLPSPLAAGSLADWMLVPLPAVLAWGMGRHASQAHARGDSTGATRLLGWAVTAVVFIALAGGH